MSENKSPVLPQHVRDVLDSDARNAVLASLEVAGGGSFTDFDTITRMASQIMQAPVALVTLVGREQQHFRSKVGTDLDSTPAEISFCAHTIAEKDNTLLVVQDAKSDPRFAENPLVTDDPKIRFYAGAPLNVAGQKIGTLCVLDTQARQPTADQLVQLNSLAVLASSFMHLKDGARRGDIARTALIREKKRHSLALEAANIASWVWDLRTNMVDCDELLPPMFGLPVRRPYRSPRSGSHHGQAGRAAGNGPAALRHAKRQRLHRRIPGPPRQARRMARRTRSRARP